MMRSMFAGECPNCVFGKIFGGAFQAKRRCDNCGMRFDADGSNWLSVGFLCYVIGAIAVAGEGVVLGAAVGLFSGFEWVLVISGIIIVATIYRPVYGFWVWCLWTLGFLDLE